MDAERSRLVDHNQETRDGEAHALLQPSDEREEGPINNKRLLLYALPALLLCSFVIRFDSSYLIGNYSRHIASELHDFGHARWLVLGFIVTESSFCPLYGHAAQVYSHRSATLAAATLLLIGLIFCSLSYTTWQLAISRAIVGTGTAGIELLVVILINDFVQLYELPLWNSVTVFIGTIGLMLGGPVGATLTNRFGFRVTFGLETICVATALVIIYFTLRLPPSRKQTRPHTPRKIEWPSALLLLISVAALVFPMNIGGEVLPWGHPLVISLFCLTPVFMLFFYYAETRIARTPIIPKAFLKNNDIAMVLACTLPMKFCFDQLRFSFGTYVEARSFTNHTSYTDWALTFVYLGRSMGTIVSGLLIRRLRKYTALLKLNIVVDIAIYLLFSLGYMRPEAPAFAPIMVLVGAAEGFAESLFLVAILSLVDTEDQPLLYAFYSLAMALSGDLGIAISLAAEGALVKSKLHASLSGYPDADEIIRKSLADLDYVHTLPVRLQQIIVNALSKSTETAFGISCAVLFVSLAASFWVKEMHVGTGKGGYVA